mmetsp:Transcript_19881/g.53189  ORF Transcript_19881/g.53189 Transcript_19881/m.53189 type:complete len:535 (-) Transcript_19881:450-2054(-)
MADDMSDMSGVVPNMVHEDEFADLNSIIFTTSFLVLLAIGYRIKTNRLSYLPESGAAMIIGFLVALMVRMLGLKEEEHILDFNGEFFFYVLLPPIIFEAGLSLDTKMFADNIGAILAYAVVGTIVSTLVVTNGLLFLARYGWIGLVDQRLGICCYLFGALISAVDPVAVIALFGGTRFRADPVLVSIVGGESVLNDAVAIVLFTSLEKHIDEDQPALLTTDVLGHFVLVSIGSLVFGLSAGAVVSWCYRQAVYFNMFPHYEIGAMCLSAYLTFALSQFCGLSGIVSLFFFGIMLEHYNWHNLSESSKVASKVSFRTLAMLSEAFVFVYLGVVVALSLNRFHWNLWLVFVSMILCVVGRAVHVFPISWALNVQRSQKIPFNMQLMIWFSGLRGAIAFALSLRIPCNGGPRANRGESECRNSDLLVTTTISIVFLTSMICGTSMESVATALGLIQPAPPLPSPCTSPMNTGVDDADPSPMNIAGRIDFDELRVNVRGHLYQVLTTFDAEVLRPHMGGPGQSYEDSEVVELVRTGSG